MFRGRRRFRTGIWSEAHPASLQQGQALRAGTRRAFERCNEPAGDDPISRKHLVRHWRADSPDTGSP